jgi:hypothetical protein
MSNWISSHDISEFLIAFGNCFVTVAPPTGQSVGSKFAAEAT